MKRIILSCLAASLCALSAMADDHVINFNQLPSAAQQLIETYFDKNDIRTVTADMHGSRTDYEEKFYDGSSIEFDTDGQWDEIDSKVTAINETLVPVAILETIKTRYGKDAKVKKIKIDRQEYEVDLDNGAELEFNSNFKLK